LSIWIGQQYWKRVLSKVKIYFHAIEMQVTELRILYNISNGTSAEKMLGNIITSDAEGSEEKTESAQDARNEQ
jgi:hypothetical protein